MKRLLLIVAMSLAVCACAGPSIPCRVAHDQAMEYLRAGQPAEGLGIYRLWLEECP